MIVGLARTSPLIWYATRGTGFVALALLTVTVVLGVAQVARWAPAGSPRFVVNALHRNASLLAVAFVGVHVATSVLDTFVHLRVLDAFVPFVAAYRPFWLGLGAVALDLMLALVVTSLLRRRLPYGTWRWVHWMAYLCWPIALLHGLGTGTDRTTHWGLLFDAACFFLVVAAGAWRLLAGSPPANPPASPPAGDAGRTPASSGGRTW